MCHYLIDKERERRERERERERESEILTNEGTILSFNTPVSSYDVVTSLCSYSSVSEVRKVFVYVNGGTDAA